MTSSCAGFQERVKELQNEIIEIQERLPEAARQDRPRLEKRLEQLRTSVRGAQAELARCLAENAPPPAPRPDPAASLRATRGLDSAVTAVGAAAVTHRRAVGADLQRGVVVIFDSETGDLVRNRSFDGAVLTQPVFDPVGDFFFAAGGYDKVLRVVDVDGEIVWRAVHDALITSVAVSPKSGELVVTAAGFGDKRVRAFAAAPGGDDRQDHRPLWESLQPSSVTLVAVSGDDRFVAAALKDHSVRLLDAGTGATVQTFPHETRIEHLAFDSVGRLLAVADADGTVQLIDASQGRQIGLIPHPAPLVSLTFNHDGTRLVTATTEFDNTVRVWKPESGESETVFTVSAPAPVIAIACSPTESRLAIATSGADPQIFDPTTRALDRKVPSGVATALAYSPDGQLLVVAAGQQAKVFNTR